MYNNLNMSIRYYWKKGYYSGLTMHEIKSTWPSIDSVDAAYEFSGRDISFLFNGKVSFPIESLSGV